MKNLKYLAYLVTFLLYACSDSDKIHLVKNQKTDYRIVIRKNASELEQKAADELKRYIQQSTGVILPVDSLFNASAKSIFIDVDTNSNVEEYIKFELKGENIHITGGNPQYSLYAVYEFLEQFLGCRFYSPDVEKVPQKSVVEIPKNLHYEYSPRINTRTVHSKLFYENHEFADKQRVTHEAFPHYIKKARVHTFHIFVPAETYYKKHPEYYALVNGKRRTTQLCLSNPEVYKIVKNEVAEFFAEQPQATVISVSQDDNTQYCKCDDCSKIDKEEGSPSGSMIRFVNKIAENFPDKTISTLAYQYTRKACKTSPADNVLITLCSIECDRSAPIEEKCKDFAEDLKQWKKLTPNIRIWDYTTQFTNFLAPFPNIHTLKPNISFFVDNNAKWVFEQHSHNPSELFELRSYLMARLLWNPELDTDSIITDFTDGYYEDAAPYVRKYIKLLHKKIQEDKDFFLFLYGGPTQAFNSFLNAENLNQYNKFFDEAEKQASEKTEILRRVQKARLSVRYATLEACRANLSDMYTLKNKNFVDQEYKKFVHTCEIEGIEWMNETRFSVKEYTNLYQTNMQRANTTNFAFGKKVSLQTKPKKYADENPLVLADGVFGGGSFYSNWLGFEGNDMIAIVDLGEQREIQNISTVFLQVVNHIVFLPVQVTYSYSVDGKRFVELGKINNPKPLSKKSKTNDTQNFELKFSKIDAKYIKIHAKNMNFPPSWHHGTGLPSWIFADEIIIN